MTALQIRADIRILTEGWVERIDGRPVRHAGLLEQLRDQVVDAGGLREENRSGKAVGPKLPCDEGALSLLVEAEREIATLASWVSLGRATQSAALNLQWLHDLAPDLGLEATVLVGEGLARVRSRIEVYLQWLDGGTHTYFRCPRCEHRDIWLHASDPGQEVAICRHCDERWHGEGGLRALNSELGRG